MLNLLLFQFQTIILVSSDAEIIILLLIYIILNTLFVCPWRILIGLDLPNYQI